VEIKPVFVQGKNYTLVTNCYQAVVLFLFNRNQTLTYRQIQEMTAIPEQELNPALVYLCNPKQKILDKENKKEPKFDPNEKLSVFLGFTNPNLKPSYIPQPKKVSSSQPKPPPIPDDVDVERRNILDAVIVRIMKARKTEKHN
jgi:Cullin family